CSPPELSFSARPTCRCCFPIRRATTRFTGRPTTRGIRREPRVGPRAVLRLLAAGLTGLELDSDIGGSIRNPAHCCGVFGHKPAYGMGPPGGQALRGSVAASAISVIGPLARSAEDLAFALDIIAGPDPIEAAGWRLDLAAPRGKALADFRIAVM